MSRPHSVELPYSTDSATLFARVAELPWTIFLDSGQPHIGQGRYDILAADPGITLTTRGPLTEIHTAAGVEISTESPYALVRRYLGPVEPSVSGLPFRGGAMGYFSYDLGRRFERLPVKAADTDPVPDMAIGIYDWAVVVDHLRRRSQLVALGRDPRTLDRWAELCDCFDTSRSVPPVSKPFRVLEAPTSNLSFAQYANAFHRIKHYIREGDCYQVNLAQCFSAKVEGSLWQAYRVLRSLNPAPFAAFLHTPYCQILSSSPERFLRVESGRVETKPIKGTRPRAQDRGIDRAYAQDLRTSVKDRAENLMIVDLMRNDLGKVCDLGSVTVPKLFDVETYASVHHMVSTVTGKLRRDCDALALLQACFPGGSITGAPKLRAMEIIEELEPHRRGVYCGAIGYVGVDGSMDTNIAIRTLVHSGETLRFWAGGGIVHDSELEAEYQETLDKVAPLLSLLKLTESDYVDCEDRRQFIHG